MRKVFCLKCRAVYGHTVIMFPSEQARNDRADQLVHAGHAVTVYSERH